MTRSSSRFSAVSHPGVSLFRRFCGTKTPGWQNLVFWTQNQQRTHHKVGTARPPKAIHTAIYAKGACPYTHRATDNRHTKCAGLSWWLFGSRRARIGCSGAPKLPQQFSRAARPASLSTWHGRARKTAGLVQNVWGDPLQTILARLEPNNHQGSPAHLV